MSTRFCLSIIALGALAAAAGISAPGEDPMAKAAIAFLESLDEEQREKCTFAFDDTERRNWQAAPMGDAGVRFDTLSEEQQSEVRDLLKGALSAEGLKAVDGVRRLEGILVAMEKARGQVSRFHGPGRYFLTVCGAPASSAPWGWRIEGHHLSFTFTSVRGEWTAHGPLFVGSQPALVRGGEHDGFRLLGSQDDNVRALYLSLDAKQQELATDQGELPGNVLLLPGLDQGFDNPGGLVASEMTEKQRATLEKALFEWADWLRPDLAQAEKGRIRSGITKTRLLWRGEPGRDEPHYWRIVGPHFAIEYAAPERDPDHVHALWRDTKNDFGGDLLKRHLEKDHGGR
ncbi:MAG: DUF3500 domain-containing protein [Planctomycetota bacterium]